MRPYNAYQYLHLILFRLLIKLANCCLPFFNKQMGFPLLISFYKNLRILTNFNFILNINLSSTLPNFNPEKRYL